MRTPARPGFILVAARELRWIRRDRTALFLLVGVPLIAPVVSLNDRPAGSAPDEIANV